MTGPYISVFTPPAPSFNLWPCVSSALLSWLIWVLAAGTAGIKGLWMHTGSLMGWRWLSRSNVEMQCCHIQWVTFFFCPLELGRGFGWYSHCYRLKRLVKSYLLFFPKDRFCFATHKIWALIIPYWADTCQLMPISVQGHRRLCPQTAPCEWQHHFQQQTNVPLFPGLDPPVVASGRSCVSSCTFCSMLNTGARMLIISAACSSCPEWLESSQLIVIPL